MNGDDLVRYLNEHDTYGPRIIEQEEEAEIYGDGQVGWSYLDVKPDPDIYGTLGKQEDRQERSRC